MSNIIWMKSSSVIKSSKSWQIDFHSCFGNKPLGNLWPNKNCLITHISLTPMQVELFSSGARSGKLIGMSFNFSRSFKLIFLLPLLSSSALTMRQKSFNRQTDITAPTSPPNAFKHMCTNPLVRCNDTQSSINSSLYSFEHPSNLKLISIVSKFSVGEEASFAPLDGLVLNQLTD